MDFIKKMVEDKREYRELMNRMAALPGEYRFVMKKMHNYMWGLAAGDGSDMIQAERELIELMEAGVAENRPVLEITGDDVAGFMDEYLRDVKKWTDSPYDKLNRDMQGKMGNGGNAK